MIKVSLILNIKDEFDIHFLKGKVIRAPFEIGERKQISIDEFSETHLRVISCADYTLCLEVEENTGDDEYLLLKVDCGGASETIVEVEGVSPRTIEGNTHSFLSYKISERM